MENVSSEEILNVSLPHYQNNYCISTVFYFPGGSDCIASACIVGTQVQSLSRKDPLK